MLNSLNYDIRVKAYTKGGATVSIAQQSLQEIYNSYLGESVIIIIIALSALIHMHSTLRRLFVIGSAQILYAVSVNNR